MKHPLRIAAATAALLLMSAQFVVASGPRSATKEYLVGLQPGQSAKGLSIAGVKVVKEWSDLGAALVEADSAGQARLAAHGSVAYVEENRIVEAYGQFSDNGEYTWGLAAVRAQEAWNLGATGAGRKVCILDTGIDYNHPEFYRNGVSIVKGSKNFVADGHATAADGNGHGTHVAGTVAAQPDGQGVEGVAPNVDLYVARVLGDNGSGSTSGIIDGLNWCVSQGVNIASLSLGSSRGSITEENAFNSAYNKGVLIIAASGNDGTNRISYPAKYSSVVAVGAVDNNLTLASFSQYGKEQEVVAPGVSVLSSVPLGTGLAGVASEAGVSYKAQPLEFANKGTVSGPVVECGLGDSTSSCTGKPASGAWVALVSRGGIAFSDKVNNVKAQGAGAVIITNNDTAFPDDAGNFTLGAEGAWIPTVSVSYNSGVAIRSGGLSTGTAGVTASDYAYFDGTSMATPHVSAVAAVAWSANPALTNVQMRSVLRSTSKDLGAAGWDNQYGYGLVQADAAVTRAQNTK